MYTDQFKQPQGNYKSPDGCSFDTAEDYLQIELMKFCGCGHPDYNLQYIRDVLLHVDRLKQEVWEKITPYDSWNADGKKLFTSDGQEYFTYYVLTERELIEHGGSVPGWLTELGYQVLEELQHLYPKEVIKP